ncbi:MAG: DUF4231 domain-containing protein [Terriglobales bacterium]
MNQQMIRDDDLPALFCAADQAASRSRLLHVTLTATNLGLLALGALFDVASPHTEYKRVFSIASAICFLLTVFITITLAALKLEQKWYLGRAVAESVKTLSWKYMMRVDSETGISADTPEKRLTIDLGAILGEFQEIGSLLGGKAAGKDQISSAMKAVRSATFSDRKQTYMEQRIKQQRDWYSTKSGKNKSTSYLFLIALILCQFLAVVTSAISIVKEQVNLAPLFAAVASSLIAWAQLRQYDELAQSYGMAAQELGLIEEQGKQDVPELDFPQFVVKAETAISREHTLWRARRVGK